jgi:hypothetical protein
MADVQRRKVGQGKAVTAGNPAHAAQTAHPQAKYLLLLLLPMSVQSAKPNIIGLTRQNRAHKHQNIRAATVQATEFLCCSRSTLGPRRQKQTDRVARMCFCFSFRY